MAHFKLLAILIVATVCYVSLIDTAAVRSEEFAERLQRMALDVGPEKFRSQRDTETKLKCFSTPCGWAVYTPFTRNIVYFMRNTCVCPDKTYKCVRAEDDLSVSAYVYRCRQNTTADDIDLPSRVN